MRKVSMDSQTLKYFKLTERHYDIWYMSHWNCGWLLVKPNIWYLCIPTLSSFAHSNIVLIVFCQHHLISLLLYILYAHRHVPLMSAGVVKVYTIHIPKCNMIVVFNFNHSFAFLSVAGLASTSAVLISLIPVGSPLCAITTDSHT